MAGSTGALETGDEVACAAASHEDSAMNSDSEKETSIPLRECYTPPEDALPQHGYQRSMSEIKGWFESGRVAALRTPAVRLLIVLLVGWVLLNPSLLRMLFHLAVGWVVFLWETIPRIRMDMSSIVNGIIGLVVTCAVLHWLLAKVSGFTPTAGRRWRWSATLSIVAAGAVMFGICVATVGLVTSVEWASSSSGKMRGSLGKPRDQNKHNARYLVSFAGNEALQRDGRLPEHLFGTIAMASSLFNEPYITFFNEDIEQPPEYFTWLGNGLRVLEAPGDVPVAAAPHPYADGTRLVAFLDETVKECAEVEWQAALSRWRQAVANTEGRTEVK
jgi:hypothetical protein